MLEQGSRAFKGITAEYLTDQEKIHRVTGNTKNIIDKGVKDMFTGGNGFITLIIALFVLSIVLSCAIGG